MRDLSFISSIFSAHSRTHQTYTDRAHNTQAILCYRNTHSSWPASSLTRCRYSAVVFTATPRMTRGGALSAMRLSMVSACENTNAREGGYDHGHRYYTPQVPRVGQNASQLAAMPRQQQAHSPPPHTPHCTVDTMRPCVPVRRSANPFPRSGCGPSASARAQSHPAYSKPQPRQER
jgi:hypothetical protein